MVEEKERKAECETDERSESCKKSEGRRKEEEKNENGGRRMLKVMSCLRSPRLKVFGGKRNKK